MWDSSALHAIVQRFPRKEYCQLVRETLEAMRAKAAQSKRDEERLADIYKKVLGLYLVSRENQSETTRREELTFLPCTCGYSLLPENNLGCVANPMARGLWFEGKR